MTVNLQPHLKNAFIRAIPLQQDDFEALYALASDPLVWEQHPNKNRYQRAVFESFFKGAMESKSALLVYDAVTDEVIGTSRYYDFNETEKSVVIGYTFFGRSAWGTGHNTALKKSMVEHAFTFADVVYFHIGHRNFRSQKAIEKLGAIKVSEQEVAYYGEPPTLNFIYRIDKTGL